MDNQTTTGFDIVLKSIQLEDFRQFRSIDIPFSESPNPTVFIADNGGGKTTVLDALAEGLKIFLATLLGRSFKPDQPLANSKDIKISSSNAALITVCANISYPIRELTFSEEEKDKNGDTVLTENGEPIMEEKYNYQTQQADYEFVLEIKKNGRLEYDVKNKTNPNEVAIIGQSFAEAFTLGVDHLPVLAYYGGNNLDNVSLREERIDDLEKLYRQALLPDRFSFRVFTEWFDTQYKVGNLGEDNTAKKIAAKNLSIITTCIETMLNETTKVYEKPRMSYHVEYNDFCIGKLNPADGKFEAIEFAQLSAGEKNIVAIAGDLARRLIIANPKSDSPLDGQGIVLIDEIDLHLHPKWQYKVLTKLREIFPNVQFVVTTHSPAVLSEIPSKHVLRLSENNVFGVENTQGQDYNTLLQNMGLPIANYDIIVKTYEALVSNDLEQAKQLLSKLKENTEGMSSELAQLEALIELKKHELLHEIH